MHAPSTDHVSRDRSEPLAVLTARLLLDRVEALLAEFRRDDGVARPLALYQAQYYAMTAMLRSVGHVLHKVDADSQARKQWLDEQWRRWRVEPIFADFIDFERNRLLKEFRGAFGDRDPAVHVAAATADAYSPGGALLLVRVDVDALRAADGTSLVHRFGEAVDYWRRHLSEAEQAFGRLD